MILYTEIKDTTAQFTQRVHCPQPSTVARHPVPCSTRLDHVVKLMTEEAVLATECLYTVCAPWCSRSNQQCHSIAADVNPHSAPPVSEITAANPAERTVLITMISPRI